MDKIKNHISVAILAGGMGSRLKSRTGNLPKPMALLAGKPILEHQIELCKKYGFTNIALLAHYEHELISKYFKDGSNWGVVISYIIEKEPRGTAGALFDSLDFLTDYFLVLYGDTFLDVNLDSIIAAPQQTQTTVVPVFCHLKSHSKLCDQHLVAHAKFKKHC